jgi:hypothetical protein
MRPRFAGWRLTPDPAYQALLANKTILSRSRFANTV